MEHAGARPAGVEKPACLLADRGIPRGLEKNALYTASRLSARLYRLWQRFKAAARLSSAREARSDSWRLGAFARDVPPLITSVDVFVGTPDPAQKVTIQPGFPIYIAFHR